MKGVQRGLIISTSTQYSKLKYSSVQYGLIISISVGGGNLMIHHAMWIWTQAVLLCAAFDADSKSDGSQ